MRRLGIYCTYRRNAQSRWKMTFTNSFTLAFSAEYTFCSALGFDRALREERRTERTLDSTRRQVKYYETGRERENMYHAALLGSYLSLFRGGRKAGRKRTKIVAKRGFIPHMWYEELSCSE